MGNIIYDLADNGLGTDYVVESIIKKLNERYKRDFEVVKIGERFGKGKFEKATAICSIKNYNEFLFRVEYDMVKEEIIEENFLIRCTCYFLEKEINRLLRNIDSIARVEIHKKGRLDAIYKTNEFIEKFPNDTFVATVIIESCNEERFSELLSELCLMYENISMSMIAYELDKDDFEIFFRDNQNTDDIPMSYIENFKSCKRQIFKVEDGVIK